MREQPPGRQLAGLAVAFWHFHCAGCGESARHNYYRRKPRADGERFVATEKADAEKGMRQAGWGKVVGLWHCPACRKMIEGRK